MRVFVLNTGRCGSTTFAAACQHLSNFTAGHESRATGRHGNDRFAYSDQHIEVDNRLSWFLGALDDKYGDDPDVVWVHLTRDPDAVARSFLRRWDYSRRGGIIEAFAHAIVMSARDWDEGERLELCRFYVETVTRNISHFLHGRDNVLPMRLETMDNDFPRFLERIGAEGNLDAACSEWSTRHAATPPVGR